MNIHKCCLGIMGFLYSFLLVSALGAQTPLKTLTVPQGGKIVYGSIDGANNQKDAILGMLRIMHKNCSEKPQIAQVFRLHGSDTVGVYFTVTNRAAGNVKYAGLILAAANGANKAEAALMSDSAARFSSSINPMLSKLFSVWRPGGMPAPSAISSKPSNAPSRAPGNAPQASARSGPAAQLHTVTASDNSESIGVPEGWKLNPASGHGTMIVTGPKGETVALGMGKTGVDTTCAWWRNYARMGGKPMPGELVYPYHGNLARAFPEMVQAWRRAAGLGPTKLQIDTITSTAPPQNSPRGEECVLVNGHFDPDGKGLKKWSEMACATLPADWGGYNFNRYQTLAPDSVFDQERATMKAISASWKLNEQVLDQQTAAMKRKKEADDAAITQAGRERIGQLEQTGREAQARAQAQDKLNDAQHAQYWQQQQINDAQHAQYWQQQDDNGKQGQGFDNYIRDQTVIHDVQNPDTTHVTVWNQTATTLEQAFPNRVEEVPTPQYIKGTDYY
jgi:hypothetical protein